MKECPDLRNFAIEKIAIIKSPSHISMHLQLLDKVKSSLSVAIPSFSSTIEIEGSDTAAEDTVTASNDIQMDENVQKILDSIESGRVSKSFAAKSKCVKILVLLISLTYQLIAVLFHFFRIIS